MFLARSPALWGLAVGCYLAEPEHTDIKLKYGEVPGFGFEFDDYTQVTHLLVAGEGRGGQRAPMAGSAGEDGLSGG